MGNSILLSALFILLGLMVGYYSILPINSHLMFNINQLSVSLVQISLIFLSIGFSIFNFITAIRKILRLSIVIGSNDQKKNSNSFRW